MLQKRQKETHCRCQREALPESRVRNTLAWIPGLSNLDTVLILNFVTWNLMKSVSLSVYISFLHTNNPAGTAFIFFCTYSKWERARDVYTVFHFPTSEWDMAPVLRRQDWRELNAIWCFRGFQFKELEDRTEAWKTASTQRAEGRGQATVLRVAKSQTWRPWLNMCLLGIGFCKESDTTKRLNWTELMLAKPCECIKNHWIVYFKVADFCGM